MSFDATIVVRFGDQASDDAFAVVELDDTRNLDSEGDVKTTFLPGDEVFFRVHLYEADIQRITKTSGVVTDYGDDTFDVEDSIQFIELDSEETLNYYPIGNVSYDWYKNNDGIIQKSGRKLTNKFDGPCIGEMTYKFSARVFKYTPPSLNLDPGEEFKALIVIYVE